MALRRPPLTLAIALVPLLGLACGSQPIAPGDAWEEDATEVGSDWSEDLIYPGFSWVREGELAGMSHPGYGDTLEERLEFLEQRDLGLLFSLTTASLPEDEVAAHGIELVHLPVADFTAPTLDQLLVFIAATQLSLDAGEPVGVHCGGGKGRTGTFLAAWFVWEGMTAAEALQEIRRLRPGSVETDSQEEIVFELQDFLDGGGLPSFEAKST